MHVRPETRGQSGSYWEGIEDPRFGKAALQFDVVVAIDGKELRRSFDRASGKSALHMVSPWGQEQRLVLTQIATNARSNEITFVPRMLALKARCLTMWSCCSMIRS